MEKTSPRNVIEIPKEVWETAETKEDMEDWLLARNLGLLSQLRRNPGSPWNYSDAGSP